MKLSRHLFISSWALSSSMFANATEIGMHAGQFTPSHRSETVNYFVWYPAEKDGTVIEYGDSPIMFGKTARKNASVQDGKFPLVILSHGGGGNAGQLGWLTEPLVKAGYVVTAVNHPGSTTGNASAKGILSLWNRPQDISKLLDLLETKAPLKSHIESHIDFDRITALGFSAGGYAVLNVAGAKPDTQKLRHYCKATNKGQMTENFCQFLFRVGGKDVFQQIDWQPAGKDYRDRRINKIIAVDPGVADAMDMSSFNELPETLFINLGVGDSQSVVDAKPLHNKLTHSTYQQVADANHFSFLGICKPNAKAILAEEGEGDPLCDVPEGAKRSREAVHNELIDIVLNFLAK